MAPHQTSRFGPQSSAASEARALMGAEGWRAGFKTTKPKSVLGEGIGSNSKGYCRSVWPTVLGHVSCEFQTIDHLWELGMITCLHAYCQFSFHLRSFFSATGVTQHHLRRRNQLLTYLLPFFFLVQLLDFFEVIF